jgi:2-C-methyl-D-erythritol 2,4-cyclodiphosphate synthase
MYRVGLGYDIHRLTTKRPLILGGVEIPSKRGLLGHSDADIICHAIADAVLGACGLGDIGEHFPNTDPCFCGASSLELLSRVMRLAARARRRVVNVDVMVLLEAPKIGPFREAMKKNLSRVLRVTPGYFSIKATTFEGVGPIGRGSAAAATAVVLMRRISK